MKNEIYNLATLTFYKPACTKTTAATALCFRACTQIQTRGLNTKGMAAASRISQRKRIREATNFPFLQKNSLFWWLIFVFVELQHLVRVRLFVCTCVVFHHAHSYG